MSGLKMISDGHTGESTTIGTLGYVEETFTGFYLRSESALLPFATKEMQSVSRSVDT